MNYNDFGPYNPIDCDIDNDSDGTCLTSAHNFMYNYVPNLATSTAGYTCEDSNCYMHSSNAARWNPCLLNYDDYICARCKWGMARIFNLDGVFCGYVSEVIRAYDSDDYYNDPLDSSTWTGEITQSVCTIDYYYEAVDGIDRSKYTHSLTNRYVNHTTGYAESLCVQDVFDADEGFDYLANCTALGATYYKTDTLFA